jgi:predicted DNA-binding WGR domain protein
MQLFLFPDLPAAAPRSPGDRPAPVPDLARVGILLTRIRPEQNEWRFYRLELWPDLFGQVCLVREWGRIGRPGRLRLDPFSDGVCARSARDRLADAKRRRGYQVVA